MGVGGLQIQEIETAGFKGSRQEKTGFCPVFPPALPGLNESAAGQISSVWANRCFQAGCTGAARPSCLRTTNTVLSISRFSEPDRGLGFVPANCDLPEPRVPERFLEVRDMEDRVFLLLQGLPPAAVGRGGSQGATGPGVIPRPGQIPQERAAEGSWVGHRPCPEMNKTHAETPEAAVLWWDTSRAVTSGV